MGRLVIVAYRPLPGRERDLQRLAMQHYERLRCEELVTARPPVLMCAEDGTVIEVFEWASPEAMAAAHTNPVVQRMWSEYAEVCEYVPLNSLQEANSLFAEFTPLTAPLEQEASGAREHGHRDK